MKQMGMWIRSDIAHSPGENKGSEMNGVTGNSQRPPENAGIMTDHSRRRVESEAPEVNAMRRACGLIVRARDNLYGEKVQARNLWDLAFHSDKEESCADFL